MIAPDLSSRADTAPLVCVIVLNYNGVKHLRYCLPSLLQTTYPNYRILLVDNASKDESRDYTGQQYPAVEIIASPRNLGWSGGNNLGIREAQARGAKYVILANNDIQVDPRWIEGAVRTAEENPQVGIVGFEVFEADGKLENDGAYLAARRAWQRLATLPPGDVGGMSMFIRCQLFDEIGTIDEGYFVYGEENDFQIRAEKAGYRTVSINVPVWHYGQGFFGSVPTRAAMLQTRSKIRLLIKHGSPWSMLRGGFRHLFGRLIRTSAQPAANVVEKRLKPSTNPFVNLGLFFYCLSWNVWFLPRTLARRWSDDRRAAAVRRRWA